MVYGVLASSPSITLYSFVWSVADRGTVATTTLPAAFTILIEVTGAPLVVQRARTEFNVISLMPGDLSIDDNVFTAPRYDHFESMVLSLATAFTCNWYS